MPTPGLWSDKVYQPGRYVFPFVEEEFDFDSIRRAASRTRRLPAFNYPRDRWSDIDGPRELLAAAERQPISDFDHPPERMGAVLETAGLVRVARQGTLVWVLDLYRRRETV